VIYEGVIAGREFGALRCTYADWEKLSCWNEHTMTYLMNVETEQGLERESGI